MARPFKWSRLNTAFKWYYKFFSILQNKICNFDQFWLQPFLRVEGLSPIHQKVLMKWLIYKNIKFFVNDILRKLKWKKKIQDFNPVEVLNFFQASLLNCINCVHCDDHFFTFIKFFGDKNTTQLLTTSNSQLPFTWETGKIHMAFKGGAGWLEAKHNLQTAQEWSNI